MKYFNETNQDCGLYYIINTKNNNIYIGSSIMLFKRYKEHFLKLRTNKHPNIHLQNAYNKYNENYFEFHVFKGFTNISDHLLRFYEGMCIRLFEAEYNICIFPENSGKPNYKRKLSEEWIYNLRKNNNYKHSINDTIYKKVIKQNKLGATSIKLIFLDKILIFNSIKEACLYFKCNTFNHTILQHACIKNNATFEIIKTQKKKVKLSKDNKHLYFNSAGECDRHLNLWRGCTSNSIKNLNGNLFEYKAEYIL